MDPSVLEYLRAAAAAHKAAQSTPSSRLGSLSAAPGAFGQQPPRPPSTLGQGLTLGARGQAGRQVISGGFNRPSAQLRPNVGLQKSISLNSNKKGKPAMARWGLFSQDHAVRVMAPTMPKLKVTLKDTYVPDKIIHAIMLLVVACPATSGFSFGSLGEPGSNLSILLMSISMQCFYELTCKCLILSDGLTATPPLSISLSPLHTY